MTKKKQLTDNALQVAQNRYFMDGENWETCTKRVAFNTSILEGNNTSKYTELFHEMIYNMDFLPAGRILRNSGRQRGSLLNCYHIPIGDSIKEIGECIATCLTLWSSGGGCGVNFSSLRPKNDPILGKGGKSSGLVSFIEAIDSVADTIESGGSRRAAAIGHVDVSHPEIIDFIDAKLTHGKLSHFNISVVINEAFLEAVESDSMWQFKFNHKNYGEIRARELWDKIVTNMVTCAEPGLINWNRFEKNNSYYFAPVRGTNPCGETVLEADGSCCLGSLVLPNFITGNINTNWNKLRDIIFLSIRFLDNILDCNKYELPEIDIAAHRSRRIGLGVMGLAEYLFAKKVRYGSEKALVEVEKLMRFIRDTSYEASMKLAIEKGSFPAFDPIAYGKASFVRKLPAELRIDIKKNGIRNVTCLAMAPTGTISLLAECTGGIEPLFAKAYKRQDRVSDRVYVHPLYEDLLRSGEEIPEWFVDTFDLDPRDHFNTQASVQKHVDGSVSKTINLPEETTPEQLSELLLENMKDLKGCTCYRNNCRGGQPLNSLTETEARNYLKEQIDTTQRDEADSRCASGKCEI